jgi:hypothetical protein
MTTYIINPKTSHTMLSFKPYTTYEVVVETPNEFIKHKQVVFQNGKTTFDTPEEATDRYLKEIKPHDSNSRILYWNGLNYENPPMYHDLTAIF